MLTQKIEDVLSKPVVKDNQAELFRTAYQAIRGKQIDLSALHSQKVFAIVAHDADGFQQRRRVQIKDRLCARLVARLHAVAGEA